MVYYIISYVQFWYIYNSHHVPSECFLSLKIKPSWKQVRRKLTIPLVFLCPSRPLSVRFSNPSIARYRNPDYKHTRTVRSRIFRHTWLIPRTRIASTYILRNFSSRPFPSVWKKGEISVSFIINICVSLRSQIQIIIRWKQVRFLLIKHSVFNLPLRVSLLHKHKLAPKGNSLIGGIHMYRDHKQHFPPSSH